MELLHTLCLGGTKNHKVPNNAMINTKEKKNESELGRRLVKGPCQGYNCQIPGINSVADSGNDNGQQNTETARKNPSVNPKPARIVDFKVLQFNTGGSIKNRKSELTNFLHVNQIHIALLQETLHNKNTSHKITGYTAYSCDCTGCRGVMTYIRNDVVAECQHLKQEDNTDVQKTTAWVQGKKYTIYNVYSPPSTTCEIEDLNETIYTNTIVAGDFNGHSPQWGYQDTNSTGQYLEDLHNSTNLTIVQNTKSPPTLLHKAHKTLSRPDLTIISSDLEPACDVQVSSDLGSDHRPIVTTFGFQEETPEMQELPRWNFQKANWSEYKITTEEEFAKLECGPNVDVNDLEESFTYIIKKAAKMHIPRGIHKNFKPFWNKEVQDAVEQRKKARNAMEALPTPENRTAYNRTTAIARRKIATAKKESWQRTCSSLDLRRDGRKAWRLLGSLSGKREKVNPHPIPEGETLKKRAERMNKHFASINKSRTDWKSDEPLLKELKEQEKKKNQSENNIFTDPFTASELETALNSLEMRKSPGPDFIHNEMLINLGYLGKTKLLNLINSTWLNGRLPKAWKNSFVTPILKPDKDPKECNSYRPISLSSCVGKVCERLVNKRLYWWLENTGNLIDEQAGFRANMRTEDQLFRLCQNIQDGFQESYHTTAVFIDLQQAYDRVWRKGLLLKMKQIGVHGKLYDWIKCFLTDRTIQTKIQSQVSSKQVLEDGLPQGSALSCTLFLIFINDMVKNLKSQKALYADDLVIWHTNKYVRQSARYLNQDLEQLIGYCKTWKMAVNTNKTVYSIFTLSPRTAKQQLDIKINNSAIKKEAEPTYLGVQLDPRLTMKKHAGNLKTKATKRLGLIKRLASTKWGSDLDTLRTLYIGYIRSVLDYNQFLVATSSKSTQLEIDRIQNQALRFICGGMKTTPNAACEVHANVEPLHLRREKSLLELKERSLRMSCTHPSRKVTQNWKEKNKLKHKSILHHANMLSERCHLPDQRAVTERISAIPPNQILVSPEIKTSLVKEMAKKETDPLDLKITAEKTIAIYPDNWTHIYTDGSAFKATVNAGYGALLCFPDGSSHEISSACGAVCSNYEAEILAIQAALEYLSRYCHDETKITNTVIFSDSKSTLQALGSDGLSTPRIIALKQEASNFISFRKRRLVLQWIPGHAGIPGNEKADRLAKHGSGLEQPQISTTYQTAKQIIKNNYKEEWMNSWARGTTGRVLYNHMSTTKTNDPIRLLNRKHQSHIFQLRVQHTPLNNHLNRINPEYPPMCVLCDSPHETVDHILFECPKLEDLRQRLLPSSPDTENTLYGNHIQLEKTSNFYGMALSRRAEAHRLD